MSNLLHRLLRRSVATMLSGVLLASLGAAAVTWVIKTRPYDPGQHRVPFVEVAARDFPAYDHAVIVLNYHDVSGRSTSPYSLTPEQLAAHLDALRKAGFHSVRLRDVEALAAGEPVVLPPKPILLTFDDGAASHWLDADPALARYGFTAVEFLITSKVVAPYRPSYHLSTEQLHRMAASGRWEFASHSDNLHTLAPIPGGKQWPALINRLVVGGQEESKAQWHARVQADLARSQAFFRRELGQAASAFAFPFGAADRPTDDPALPGEVDRLLAQAGFTFAFSTARADPSGRPSRSPRTSPRCTGWGTTPPARSAGSRAAHPPCCSPPRATGAARRRCARPSGPTTASPATSKAPPATRPPTSACGSSTCPAAEPSPRCCSAKAP